MTAADLAIEIAFQLPPLLQSVRRVIAAAG